MKKLIVAIVVASVLSVTGVAMAYGHRDGRVYMGYKGRGYEVGGWLPLPFPRTERRHGGYGRTREYQYRHGRHDRDRRRPPDHHRRERRRDREHFYFYYGF